MGQFYQLDRLVIENGISVSRESEFRHGHC